MVKMITESGKHANLTHYDIDFLKNVFWIGPKSFFVFILMNGVAVRIAYQGNICLIGARSFHQHVFSLSYKILNLTKVKELI
jgi:hypothetical protein